MIKIDFSLFLMLILNFCLFLVACHEVVYNYIKNRKSDLKEAQYLNFCPFCSYLFFRYRSSEALQCPRCKSYLEHNETEMSAK